MRKVVHTCAVGVLASLWILLGALKLAAPGRSTGLEDLLPAELAQFVALSASVGEVALGAALLLWVKLRVGSLITSLALLAAYGTWGVVRADLSCACAGRLVALPPLEHSLLTASMFVLVAAALATRPMGPEPSAGRLRATGAAIAGLVLLVMAAGLRSRPLEAHEVAPVAQPTEPSHPPPEGTGPLLLARSNSSTQAGRPDPGQDVDVGGQLIGRVESTTGAPVVGALLWLTVEGAEPGSESARMEVLGTSSAAGAFSLPIGEEDGATHLCATAPGFEPFCRALKATPVRDSEYVVVLSHGHSRRGLVQDEQGSPVSGARVEAWGLYAEDELANPRFGPRTLPQRSTCQADESGGFQLTGLSPGRYRLRATAHGHLPSTPVEIDVSHDGGAPEEHRVLVLRQLFVLKAAAIDAETGRTIPWASYEILFRRADGWAVALGTDLRNTALTGKFYAEHGLMEYVCRAGQAEGAPSVISARISAFGFEPALTRILAARLGEDDILFKVPLVPTSDHRSRVSVEARWPDGRGFTGSLVLYVHNRRYGAQSIALTFLRGECSSRLELPVAEYKLWLRPNQGSAHRWRYPSGREKLSLDVTAGRTTRALLTLRGGRVLLQPRSSSGTRFANFRWGTNGPQLRTWAGLAPYERSEGGVLVYLDSGPHTLYVGKFGYRSTSETVTVPADGGVVRWGPVLAPAQETDAR